MLESADSSSRPQAWGDQVAKTSYAYPGPTGTTVLFYSGYTSVLESGKRENSGALDLWVRIWGIVFKALSSAVNLLGSEMPEDTLLRGILTEGLS